MTVRPGDKVTASIVKVGGRSWKISISIAGRGSFTTTRTYNGGADTAEWIVEAPTVGLADRTARPPLAGPLRRPASKQAEPAAQFEPERRDGPAWCPCGHAVDPGFAT